MDKLLHFTAGLTIMVTFTWADRPRLGMPAVVVAGVVRETTQRPHNDRWESYRDIGWTVAGGIAGRLICGRN